MPVDTTERTIATSLLNSESVEAAIDSLISELKHAQASLTSAKPPISELKETYDSWLARHASVKGRNAYYPYIGSGLGNGPLVELEDGSVKWDLINGIGVHMFGHSDPDMVRAALKAAMGDTVMQGNLQYNTEAIEFGELLVKEASKSSSLKHAFLINTGAMANESALKVCMQKHDGKAPRVIAFTDCFMGRSMTMTQIGDSGANRVGLPLNTLVDYISFYDPEHGEASVDLSIRQLEQYISRYPDQHACFVMELVQGEGGFNVAPREFFIPMMEMCKKHGIPIWIDEIQTFGRTTEMFYYDVLGLGEYIDVLTLGKMSQICATMFTEEFNPKPGLLSATFIGSSVGLQVGKAMLTKLLEDGYYGPDGKIAVLQQSFRTKMHDFVELHPEWFPPIPHPHNLTRTATGFFGGVGGMMRFTPFGGDKKRVIDACHILFEEGIIAFYCGHGPYHIRFLPPVGVMQPEHFDPVIEIVEKALARVG